MEKKKELIEQVRKEMNEWLGGYFSGRGTYEKKIFEAMDYSLNANGKRIRPLLFLLGFSMFSGDYKKALPVAGAIEMIHTYSLIHDDLPAMDNDDLRRGKPTNHKVFGEAIAILAGDGLLNEAMNIMFRFCCENNMQRNLDACRLISESAGVDGMIGGQVIDMLSENMQIPLEQLYAMHSKKTGALIKASIVSGAMTGGAAADELCLLAEYGEKLGLAFQIKDDILDVSGDTEKLGKRAQSDIENKKTTFVTEYGLEKCMELCGKLTVECMENLNKISRDTSQLEEITMYLLNRDR
ncbi:MAG: geranylgeranyl pyrophosphate synthase [Firmicutes bacterium]|nr:geranylgeranyl pyrophosphate synthase [Bacillota bacterium]